MSWYRSRVERDLTRWQQAGWVNEAGASAIRTDLQSRASAFGIAPVFAILGAVLFGFAVMSFVAAHWTAMSKLARLGLLLATLWACYGGAAYLFQRQLNAFAHAAVLGGIAVYGASIMLIAQMYHMEGNPPDAVLMWALGALLAAVLVRSPPALAATFVLLVVWTCWERGLALGAHWTFLAAWAAGAAAAAWLGWRPGLHLAALSLAVWLVPLGYFILDRHAHWIVVAIGVAVAVAAAAAAPTIDRHLRASAALFAYGLLVAFAGLYILQFIDPLLLYGAQQDTASIQRLIVLAVLTLGAAARRHAVGAAHRQSRRAVARLRRVRARDLHPLPQDLRHAAQHLAVLPGGRRHRQPAGLGGLPAASAQGFTGGRRMTAPRNLLLALAIVALAQTGVLAAMVVDRVRLLKSGREITLPIVPVDPRDLFRGEYVRLGYDVGRVPVRLLEGPRPRPNAPFYVVLEKNADGAWTPVQDVPRQARRSFARPHRAQGPLGLQVADRPPRPTPIERALRHRELFRARGTGQAAREPRPREAHGGPDRRRRQRQRRHQGPHHRRRAAVRGAAFLKWRADRPVL